MDSNVPGRMTLCGGAQFLNTMPVSTVGVLRVFFDVVC